MMVQSLLRVTSLRTFANGYNILTHKAARSTALVTDEKRCSIFQESSAGTVPPQHLHHLILTRRRSRRNLQHRPAAVGAPAQVSAGEDQILGDVDVVPEDCVQQRRA